MAKEETIIKTGAYVYDVTMLPNIKFTETVEDAEVTKYKHRISITFDVKGENIVKDKESKEYYSESFDTIQTVAEWAEWQSTSILNFILSGKNDIAGYVPQQ